MDARFTYNNIELAYTIEGEGDTIVLLHGWGCDHTIWQATTEMLKANFRVIAVDFAGLGQSNEPQEVWGVEEYTQSIEALLS
ncbi:MAG: alpha/beta hydrolase, partial [Alistipes sp.]|nr:alpha/beta hydrolase [Alistipes sp.]